MFGYIVLYYYLYYVIKMIYMNKLVFSVNEENCVNFLKKYPAMAYLMFSSKYKCKSLLSAYKNFLKIKDINESKLGGNAETISSATFGTKTFYKYDWCGTGGYAEVFQYVYNKK